ncbi:S41 family peptidase [Sphingomonas sp. QA11]|uniref:S41 family peptidase n=1 Tax=Sphingomonas sp. QA11 TaxID=2950605 RepID=UPI00234B23FA|nr:S41 family peptidase [Sphingomonas sp. QA11]WCM26012.1 S41 family peptidase [Sphingomonas sp. QA11]
MRRTTVMMAATMVMLAAPARADAPATDTHATIAAAQKTIRDHYVLPAVAIALEQALARSEAAGRYRGLAGEELATRVNADLEAVAHDQHLSLRYDPKLSTQLGTDAHDDDGPAPAAIARAYDRQNAGVRELRVLPGNIRYMAYEAFVWDTPGSAQAVATAMEFLRGGDAYIIDIRRNGGGSPDAVAAIASYFVPEGTPLMRFEMRGQPPLETQAPKAPFSLASKPLYVLTSRNTASAAEEFSTHVKALGFGTLIGANTLGAGFRNNTVGLPGGYVLSVSVGRAVSRKTGSDWERIGVAPDIATPVDTALLRAQQEAMARIAAAAPADEHDEDEAILAYYRALATPVTSAHAVEAYAGAYGDRTVSVVAGDLMIARASRLPSRLVPVGPDSFAPETDPAARFNFAIGASGRAESLRIVQRGGAASVVPRDAATITKP